MVQLFDYEDILLLPRICVVNSRSECDTSVELGNRTFRIPLVPSNMSSVIDEKLAEELARRDYFYIMHRFGGDRFDFVQRMNKLGLFTSISVGIKDVEEQLIVRIAEAGLNLDYVTIDVAHGHSHAVKNMIKFVKRLLPRTFVIAGNVATPEAVRDLESWGCDCTKIGVGPGKACITKLKTGFGTSGWQLSAVKWCASVARKPTIADGGVRTHGDIAKSLRFGATLVMAGSILAGHIESPGEIIGLNGEEFKAYIGSASSQQKGEHKHVEGRALLEPMKGSIFHTLHEVEEDLQSAISYAGGTQVADLRKCAYVILGGQNEREHVFGSHSSDGSLVDTIPKELLSPQGFDPDADSTEDTATKKSGI